MPQGGRHRDSEGDRGWNEAAGSEHEGQALREAPGCRSGQETATEFCSHEQLPSANNQNTPGTGSSPWSLQEGIQLGRCLDFDGVPPGPWPYRTVI